VVARLGGDEFAVLCERLQSENLSAVAARIVRGMAEPFRVGAIDLTIGASVGVAVGRTGSVSPNDMLDCADAAMYSAKRQGKGRFQLADLPPTG
jgi:diguanylate cyclase (GGDEF)-like protein